MTTEDSKDRESTNPKISEDKKKRFGNRIKPERNLPRQTHKDGLIRTGRHRAARVEEWTVNPTVH